MKSIILMLLLLPASALAMEKQTTQCQLGNAVRLISVVYPQGTKLPCEVHYSKDGRSEVLWSARNEAGYCEQHAAAFTEKQRGWGWQCVDAAENTSSATETPTEQ
jgi:hypothetical protein